MDLYENSHEAICKEISGVSYTDDQIRETLSEVYKKYNYLLDPHGTCGYRALTEKLENGETGIFLETAHPAKFLETVEGVINTPVNIPDTLLKFMHGKKKSIEIPASFIPFKRLLLNTK